MYVVIVGAGKVGEYLASTLLESGHEVALIEKEADTADLLSSKLVGPALVILGDGCDSKYQEDAGVRKADVFVAVTGHDDDNLVACEIAQRVFNVGRCVARVNNPRNMRIFQALEIEAISSTTLIANIIEEEAIVGSMNVISSLAHGNVILLELPIQHFKHRPTAKGIRAASIELPDDSLIVATSNGDDTSIVTEETILRPGDKVIVAVDSEVADDVRAIFRSL